MKIIYCSEPFSPKQVDSMYEKEAEAAKNIGLEYELINFETLVDDNNPISAIRRIKESSTPELAIYRGWMLKPEIYTQLYNVLYQKGLYLINTPDSYKHCHYLPESYSIIEPYTPLSIWLKLEDSVNFEIIMEKLSIFGNKPIIVKDYVKSRKHEWHEACYIPSASDKKVVEKVVSHFIELQGTEINEGLVFREYIDFQPLTTHSKSGMPLTKEFRYFFLDKKLLYCLEYWEEGDYHNAVPPEELFHDVVCQVKSRFFTMDVAQRINGEWMIMELGDGQVAGLPEQTDIGRFYSTLRESILEELP